MGLSLLPEGARGRILLLLSYFSMVLQIPVQGGPAVLQETRTSIILSNGVIKVTIQKPQGFVTSYEYGTSGNLLDQTQNTAKGTAAYYDIDWSPPNSAVDNYVRVGGDQYRRVNRADDTARVEVSFSRSYDGTNGSLPLYVDTRYVLLQDTPGLYLYHIVTHNATFPDFDLQQMRTVWRLRPEFDFAAVTDSRQRVMPTASDISDAHSAPTEIAEARRLVTPGKADFAGEVNDKYHYALDSRQHTCYGWISESLGVGFWVISGSQEYLGGGFTKHDLTLHAGPLVLKMLQSRHYGTPSVQLRGENWNKAYGPYLVYVNHGTSKAASWQDAKARAKQEQASWPYDGLFSATVLRSSSERSTVKGQLVVQDPYEPQASSAFAWLGLANPGEAEAWQNDVKFYQYWVQADAQGHFAIPDVRAGTYQLFGYVPFVHGSCKAPDRLLLTPATGVLDLGVLSFEPPRDGPTLWTIGLPDRSAAELFIPKINTGSLQWPYPATSSNRFRDYGAWMRYLDFYPSGDLVYNVSSDDWARDWFFVQPVRLGSDNSSVATVWRIDFSLDRGLLTEPTANFTLRVAIAAAQSAALQVYINNIQTRAKPIYDTGKFGQDNAMARAGIHGDYADFVIKIPASKFKAGSNSLFLKQRATDYRYAHIMYDSLRLEGPGRILLQ